MFPKVEKTPLRTPNRISMELEDRRTGSKVILAIKNQVTFSLVGFFSCIAQGMVCFLSIHTEHGLIKMYNWTANDGWPLLSKVKHSNDPEAKL